MLPLPRRGIRGKPAYLPGIFIRSSNLFGADSGGPEGPASRLRPADDHFLNNARVIVSQWYVRARTRFSNASDYGTTEVVP
jgi:hypothetical protein